LLWGGSLHPKVLKEYELSVPCQALELDLTQWGLTTAPRALYSPLPRFPEAWRDIALVVPDGVTSSQVLASIEGLSIADLKGMTLFDQYRGNNVKTGCRSLAYRLRFQNVERTLTDGEVTEKVSKIVAYLKEKFSIELR